MWLMIGGISGFLAVALGAFGAHGLKSSFADHPEAAQRLAWWSTASDYHLIHSFLLVAAGLLALHGGAPSGAVKTLGIATLVGILLFSGSLYTMTLTGVRVLGAITPLGGTAFLVAWAALAYAGMKA